jgi:hypothetical protein
MTVCFLRYINKNYPVKRGRDALDHKLDHTNEAINEVVKDYNQIRQTVTGCEQRYQAGG